jgi:hypothetical protein
LIPLLLLSTLAIPIAGTVTGCASVDEGSDPIVVNAERVAQASFEIMDAFVLYEHNNREMLRGVSPEIEKAANSIRTDGRAAIDQLRAATKAYKLNRTAENKASVDTWIKLVETLKSTALRYLVAPARK